MLFKPMFEEEGYKPSDRKRPVPTHNTQHPKDARLLHRSGKAIVDGAKCGHYTRVEDGTTVQYGRRDENVRTQRGAIAGLRDKMALAASTAKVTRFVNCQAHTDRRMDTPTPLRVQEFTPRRRKMTVKAVAPCRRPL